MDNPPSETPSEYFKNAITIPMLDHLNTELDNKFKPNSVTPIMAWLLFLVKLFLYLIILTRIGRKGFKIC